jgi:hypothetical protein
LFSPRISESILELFAHGFCFTEYGNYNSSGTAYGGYAGYTQPAPAAGAAGATTAATPNYPSTQSYDQSGYNQQGSWGQQQSYGSYGATGDQSYSQQGLYAFLRIVLVSHMKYFAYFHMYEGKRFVLYHKLVTYVRTFEYWVNIVAVMK